MLEPRHAWDRIAAHIEPLPAKPVARRHAAGRVLAEALTATVDVPASDVSAMDGYAVAGEVTPGETRPVVGRIAAGDPPGAELAAGKALKIMTGAPFPRGADRVVQIELTDGGDEAVRFERGTEAGAHVRRKGEVLSAGDPLLDAGTLLTPGALSLLATHGIAEPVVHGAPRVAIVVTGDEVVPPESTPAPGQLRDSHSDFLLAACAGLGIEATALGIAADRRPALEESIARGLEHDVLLITGGVSKGEYDLVEGVLAELGCEALFDAVAIQPGKPLVAARHRRGSGAGLVFGLPGNPASVMVAFWLFVRPALRRLMGLADGYWHGALTGELVAPLPGAKGRDRFLPAAVAFCDGGLRVSPVGPKGSHDLAAYACGTALVRVPAHAEPCGPGDLCEVLPLADWRLPPAPGKRRANRD